jgi:hypothetical protein
MHVSSSSYDAVEALLAAAAAANSKAAYSKSASHADGQDFRMSALPGLGFGV